MDNRNCYTGTPKWKFWGVRGVVLDHKSHVDVGQSILFITISVH
jgi:hypothetical protein